MERPSLLPPPFSPALERGKLVSNSSLSASSVEAASLLPPPRPAPCGIFFFSSIETPASTLVFFEKHVRRAYDEIVIAFRHRWIVAPKLDSFFAAALLNLESRRTAKSVR